MVTSGDNGSDKGTRDRPTASSETVSLGGQWANARPAPTVDAFGALTAVLNPPRTWRKLCLPATRRRRPPARHGRTHSRARDSPRRNPRRDQAVRRLHGRRPRVARHPGGGVLLAPGPQRLRENDAAADAGRLRDADFRLAPHRRPRRHAAAPAPPPGEPGVPALRAVPALDGPQERRVRPAVPGGDRRGGGLPDRRGAGPGAAPRPRRAAPPPTVRRAAAAAWPSPGRWSCGRRSCCSTNL